MNTEQKTEHEKLQEVGKFAFESIAEMVAALDVDYDRLEELREMFAEWKEEALRTADTEGRERPVDLNVEDWSALSEEGQELLELEKAAGDCESLEDAEQRISDDPLAVQVRSGWCDVGEEMEAEEYNILLSTGGPATRIIGDLNQYGEPETATLQAQDWFTQWQDYEGGDEETLLRYASRFLGF
jgi:hypothetical protein